MPVPVISGPRPSRFVGVPTEGALVKTDLGFGALPAKDDAHDIEAARRRGIYVSVMLFEGWGLQFAPNAWEYHPFNPQNNVNGINSVLAEAAKQGLDIEGDGSFRRCR